MFAPAAKAVEMVVQQALVSKAVEMAALAGILTFHQAALAMAGFALLVLLKALAEGIVSWIELVGMVVVQLKAFCLSEVAFVALKQA